MKNSHLITPRSLGECEFQTWGEAIEGQPSGTTAHPAEWVILVIFVGLVARFAFGWMA